jgi:hypothetical protein
MLLNTAMIAKKRRPNFVFKMKNVNQYLAYALKSDDSKTNESKPVKNQERSYLAYAANYSDDSKKPKH